MSTSQLQIIDAARKIFEELDLDIADTEVREQMVRDLEQSIQERIMTAIIDKLSQQQRIQLDELIARKASSEEVQEFVSASVSGIPLIVSEAIVSIRNQYLTQ